MSAERRGQAAANRSSDISVIRTEVPKEGPGNGQWSQGDTGLEHLESSFQI